MNKDKQRLFEMIFFSLIVAILVTFQIVGLAFIMISPPLGFTTLHIPVLIGAMLLGRKYGWALGLSFGLLSFFTALSTAASPIARLFLNPLVSVVPRILFGILIVEILILLKRIIPDEKVAIGVTLVLSTLLHSVFVVSMILLFGHLSGEVSESLAELFAMFVTINMIIETIAAFVIGLPAIIAVKNVYHKEKISEEGSE